MRYIPYSLTLLLLLAFPAFLKGQEPEKALSNSLPPATQLLTESAQNLMKLPGLDAQFRFKIDIYNESLDGVGHYLQAGNGPDKKFRLELRTQLEDKTISLQTLCDEDYLWIRRDFGADNQSLARISMRRLKKTLKDVGPPLAIDPTPTWLGVISLPKLMSVLNGWFNFGQVEEARMGNNPIYIMRGVVNPELREKHLAPGHKQHEGAEQLPDAVRLTLGRDAELPLFPYRIEFLQLNTAAGTTAPHVTLEFHTVKVKSELDPALFKYAPGDQEVEDQTIPFLQKLGFNVTE
jgi:hypothetical protein